MVNQTDGICYNSLQKTFSKEKFHFVLIYKCPVFSMVLVRFQSVLSIARQSEVFNNPMKKKNYEKIKKKIKSMLPSAFSPSLPLQYKLLSFKTLFNPFPNKALFLHVCSTSLLKTIWEKEKLLIMSNFSFFQSIFYPMGELSTISSSLKLSSANSFSLGEFKICCS